MNFFKVSVCSVCFCVFSVFCLCVWSSSIVSSGELRETSCNRNNGQIDLTLPNQIIHLSWSFFFYDTSSELSLHLIRCIRKSHIYRLVLNTSIAEEINCFLFNWLCYNQVKTCATASRPRAKSVNCRHKNKKRIDQGRFHPWTLSLFARGFHAMYSKPNRDDLSINWNVLSRLYLSL